MWKSLAVLLVASTTAYADDDASVATPATPDVVGHFPRLSVSLVTGFDMTPVNFVDSTGLMQNDSTFNLIAAPDVMTHIDAHAFLIELEGMYNPVGDLRWVGRAHVTVGLRSKANVVKSMHDSPVDSSGYYTRTTEYYVHKFVPIYYGFTGGLSLWGFDTTTWTSYADPTDMHSRDGAVAPVADAGFTIRSPQVELTVAPQIDLSTGNMGLHWAFGLAFPIGQYPLFFRFSGDHLFGDDPVDNTGRRTAMIVMLSLGLGSSLGID